MSIFPAAIDGDLLKLIHCSCNKDDGGGGGYSSSSINDDNDA